MNQNVFRAILAMDSYNRGYRPNVQIGPVGESDVNRFVGTAQIIAQDISPTAQAVGFYASAYRWNGETIISYRGTNFDFRRDGTSFFARPAVRDIWDGWSLGAGFAGASQGQLALQFYQAVAGVDNFYAPQPLVTLTGHSLGGGLAGFVGALSGNQVYGYDHMPFAIAAYAQAISDSFTAAAERVGLLLDDLETELPSVDGSGYIFSVGISFGVFVEAFQLEYAARSPLISVSGAHIEGEILQGVRDGSLQPAIGGAVGALLGFISGGFAGSVAFSLLLTATGLALGSTTVELESDVVSSSYSAYATGDGLQANLTAAQRHSMPFLVTVMFAEEQWPFEGPANSFGNWSNGFGYVAPSLFNTRIARLGLGLGGSTGAADPATQMATMIAYSAINEGTRVFGDTGIRALFNDTADLGQALSLAGAPQALFSGANGIGSLAVEHAGLLALGQVLSANNPNATNGILNYRVGNQARGASLMIDLREMTWDAYSRNHTIVSKDALIEGLFGADISTGAQLLNRIENFYARVSGMELLPAIDRVSISLGGSQRPFQLQGEGILVSVLSDDGITAEYTGRTDFVIGGEGDDVLSGLGGHDILIGGGGNDNLLGGNGRDFLYGGTGADILEGGAGGDQLWSGPARGGSFDDRDILLGGDGNDLVNFSGGAGIAEGGAGNDAIDARLAEGLVTVVYRNGDGSDRLLYNPYDRSNMSVLEIPREYSAGVGTISFRDIPLSSVRLEWSVEIVDAIVDPDSETTALCVGIMRVFSQDGSLLMELGEVAGIVVNSGGGSPLDGYLTSHTIPWLLFRDGIAVFSSEIGNIQLDIVAEASAARSGIESFSTDDTAQSNALDFAAFTLNDEIAIAPELYLGWPRTSMPLLVEHFA